MLRSRQRLDRSDSDLDDGNVGDLTSLEVRQVNFEVIGVEPDWHVELEASGDHRAARRNVPGQEGDEAGGLVEGEAAAEAEDRAVYGDARGAGDRFSDRSDIRREACRVGLGQLPSRGRAIPDPDDLVAGSRQIGETRRTGSRTGPSSGSRRGALAAPRRRPARLRAGRSFSPRSRPGTCVAHRPRCCCAPRRLSGASRHRCGAPGRHGLRARYRSGSELR